LEVIKIYKEGYKQIEIAKHFKASKGTISDIFKKYKIKGE
jgi:transposase